MPLVLVFSILVQTAGVVWWARGQQADIDQHGQRLTALEAQRASDRVGERLSTLESQVADSKELLRRIDDRTQRLIERGQRHSP